MFSRTNRYFMARMVKRLANRFNLEVRSLARTSPADLTAHLDMHPVEAVYMAEDKSALLRVSLSRCLHMHYLASPCSKQTSSPFVHTLLDYVGGEHMHYQESRLEKFYELFQPRTATEYMDVPEGAGRAMAQIPPLAAPIFWLNQTVSGCAGRLKHKQLQGDIQNREHGASHLSWRDGHHLFGPVSQKKGELEFRRLTGICEKMRAEGFQHDKTGVDNIAAVALIHGDDWRFFLRRAGQHRAAAAVALGYNEIVLELLPEACGGIVHRDHVDHWPAVKARDIEREQALCLFDRIFSGTPPKTAENWLHHLNAQR